MKLFNYFGFVAIPKFYEKEFLCSIRMLGLYLHLQLLSGTSVQDVQLEQINNLINLVKPNLKKNILKLSPKCFLRQRFISFWYLRTPKSTIISDFDIFCTPSSCSRTTRSTHSQGWEPLVQRILVKQNYFI